MADQEVVSLIIANVGPKKPVKGSSEVRKKGIDKLLLDYNPSLILFQEFPSKRGFYWASDSVTKNYDYFGHHEASFGINKNQLIVRDPLSDLYDLKDSMILKGTIPTTIASFPRMHVLIISTKGTPELSFICVSWHGRWKTSGTTKWTQLQEELKHTLCLLQEFSERKKLPLIIAGDFNLPFKHAKEVLQSNVVLFKQDPIKGKKLKHDDPLVIYSYEPLRRKEESRMIDFYIASKSLKLREIKVIDWDALGCECVPSTTFDHDPVFSVIKACDVKAPNESVQLKKKGKKQSSSSKKI